MTRVRDPVGLVNRVTPADEESGKVSDWIAFATPDFDHLVQNAVERVFKLLDLPRRGDIDALNENLRRVAEAVERLERSRTADPTSDHEAEPQP